MVIRGRTRGNGKQLASYLLAMQENENIHILDVNGHDMANDNDLHQALFSMSVTAELTRSQKGLYHAQINPAYGEDKSMDPQAWRQAADMLGNELGLQEQRRVIVLHTKKGRTHAHVVWERYDHEKCKMKSDSYSRLAQDRARQAMEQVFQHKRTPERNASRPDMKKFLTELWQGSNTAQDFIRRAKKVGFTIATGSHRPFIVVDNTGRSFDLVRQLEGVKTKEVRLRLQEQLLITEKQAIENTRTHQITKTQANDNASTPTTVADFKEGVREIEATEIKSSSPKIKLAENLIQNSKDISQREISNLAESFAINREDTVKSDRKNKRQKVLDEIRQAFTQNKDMIRGMDTHIIAASLIVKMWQLSIAVLRWL